MPRGTLRIPRAAIAQRGFAQYAREINERAQDVSPAWDAVRQIIFDSTEDRFEKEGRRGGFRKWRALSRRPSNWLGGLSYKEWKEENFPGNPILELTGRLRDQLTGLSGDHFEARRPRRLTIGSNLPVHSGEGHDLGGIHAAGRGGPGITGARRARLERELEMFEDPRGFSGSSPYASRIAGIRQELAAGAGGYVPPMPARPPFGITTTDVNNIADVLVDYVLGNTQD